MRHGMTPQDIDPDRGSLAVCFLMWVVVMMWAEDLHSLPKPASVALLQTITKFGGHDGWGDPDSTQAFRACDPLHRCTRLHQCVWIEAWKRDDLCADSKSEQDRDFWNHSIVAYALEGQRSMPRFSHFLNCELSFGWIHGDQETLGEEAAVHVHAFLRIKAGWIWGGGKSSWAPDRHQHIRKTAPVMARVHLHDSDADILGG